MSYVSTFFQFTTVTWMMWHWLVSALSFGATIVLYDGSPFHPHGNLSMPLLLRDLNVTHFGTSAKYLSLLEQNSVAPPRLPHLKAIYSTAAVLAPSTFEYVYRAFGPINLASITGGTDIISLFGAPSPLSPVHSGEIQCLGLGMNVQSWSPAGTQVPDDTAGDLVCLTPFPCMPVCFWGGPAGEDLYKKSYFTQFPGVWHHGDFVKIVGETRGLVMLGRSDGILKPAGVRFGSAEIVNTPPPPPAPSPKQIANTRRSTTSSSHTSPRNSTTRCALAVGGPQTPTSRSCSSSSCLQARR